MAKNKTKHNIQAKEESFSQSNTIFDNPFKSIDKKNFREEKKDKKEKNFYKPKQEEKISTVAYENEEDLFLNTMNNVRNIKNSDKYAHSTLTESQNILQKKEEKANSHEMNNAFAELLPKKNKKNQNDARLEQLQNMADNMPKQNEKKAEFTGNEEYDFYQLTKDVKPLDGKERIAPPEPEKIIVQQDQAPLLHDFEEGKLDFSLSENDDHVQCNILGLDILTLAKLQQRQYTPEAHIDLHKMSVYEAYQALIGFFKSAYYRDLRCVLIVTGKGINSFDNRPLLRTKVSEWLIQKPFNNLTLAFCTAKQEDGGAGSLYVLIRKRRKNSKEIQWDVIPNDYDLWAHLDK